MTHYEKRLGDILIEQKQLEQRHLDFAIEAQRTSNLKLGEILMQQNFVSEEGIYRAIAVQCSCPFCESIEFGDLDLDLDGPLLMQQFTVMKRYLTVPLKDGSYASAAPEEVCKMTPLFGNRPIVVTPPTKLLTAVEGVFIYFFDRHLKDTQSKFDRETSMQTVGPYVDAIIRKACINRASDIHFEPEEGTCYIRFRVDGDLKIQSSYDRRLHEHIANVIQVRGTGTTSNNQRPEDSAFEYSLSDTVRISCRVSMIPTPFGVSIVVRLLKRDSMLIELEKLGFLPPQVTLLKKLVRAPYGMILLAGPTGSGKTTTLYSLVNERRGEESKIITIEDPIESLIPFLRQVQVNRAAGLTFDTAIRAFLRHDPDVMLVGEIRDNETAQMACEAALTGHLVLGTVHANSAQDAFTRLSDPKIGISCRQMTSILAVIGQRLVKRRCSCEKGCPRCNHQGYYGRVAIAEILAMSETMRACLYQDDLTKMMRTAEEEGFMPMGKIVQEYIRQGITTYQEASRWINHIAPLTSDTNPGREHS